ncbi:MAG: Gldg family protein [Planctomycetota bacterium]
MALRPHVILAVFKRNFLSYFSSVIGYLFVVAFVGLMAFRAFTPEFFADNQATLDQLNGWFSLILLFIIPAIAMTSWSEEKKQGTDELLFTLPAHDIEILLGKYFSLLAIYTTALAFSFVFGTTIVLKFLTGSSIFNPIDYDFDFTLILANYIGYWISGAALLSAAMVASVLTNSPTVAFILGSAICAVPVALGRIVFPDWGFLSKLNNLGIDEHLRDFGLGMVPLSGILYFVSFAAFMLYVNLVMIAKRHWSGGPHGSMGWHYLARGVALAVTLVCLNIAVSGFAGMRADFTAERIYSVYPTTRETLRSIDAKKPVVIQAFISPKVPGEYVATRSNLIGLLRQFDQIGGDKVRVRIVETDQFSTAADEAKGFGINPQTVQSQRGGKFSVESIYMGCVISSGSDKEVVIPFFDVGTPVEYELTRSIRTIVTDKEVRIGILTTDVKLAGGFDPATFRQSPEWRIVTELKKQYKVEQVMADSPITGTYDVLVAVLPSSLTEPQMQHFVDYVKQGKPTLIFDDPVPLFDIRSAPRQPKPSQGGGGPFGGGGQPPPQPKADNGKATRLMNLLGVAWDNGEVVFDQYTPHPEYTDLMIGPELIWVGAKSPGVGGFSAKSPVTSGLQEMLVPFPGTIRQRENAGLEFIPLLRSSTQSGTIPWEELIKETPSFFGMGGPQINREAAHMLPDGEQYVLAAQIKSKPVAKDAKEPGEQVNVIYVCDIDLISDSMFDIRERDLYNLRLDNVTFALDCVDELAGEEALIPLRKRRAKERTLTAVEARTQVFTRKRNEERDAAEKEAKKQLQEAKERLQKQIQAVQSDKTLDERAKLQKSRILQEEESRRLAIEESEIENRKKQQIEKARNESEREIRNIEFRYSLLSVILPPIPALLVGLWVFLRRSADENRNINPDRLIKQ